MIVSIRWGNIRNICSWRRLSPRKSYLFLKNFEKALLENLICSFGISFSCKILCVLLKFRTKIFWKIWSVLMVFFPPGKSYVSNFDKALLEILMCSRNLFKKVVPGINSRYFNKIARRLLLFHYTVVRKPSSTDIKNHLSC